MAYAAVIVASLLALVHLSLQTDYQGAQNELYKARKDAEARLRKALENVDSSVLTQPLKDLMNIADVGKQDIDDIKAFKGPGDKDAALAKSIKFWKEKMEEVIQPYVASPESYKGVVIADERPLHDPTWNDTAAYRNAEKEINNKVEKATQSLMKEYENLTSKYRASRLKDVTLTSWRMAGFRQALEAAVMEIINQGQRSKYDAAKGKIEKGMSWLDRIITTATATFRANIEDIYNSSK